MAFSHRLVRALCEHYAAVADLAGPFHLTLSRERFERVRKRRGYANPIADDDLGATLVGPPALIWVNTPAHRSVRQLAETCAHEVLHALLPDAIHSASFRAQVRNLVAGRDP